MTATRVASAYPWARAEVDKVIAAYEAAHWPAVRARWRLRWSQGRCMACGVPARPEYDPTLSRWQNWRARLGTRYLQVHHADYPHVLIGDRRWPVRGAGEEDTDLIELCVTTSGTPGRGCHNSGRLAGHSRWTKDLRRKTWKHVRSRRRWRCLYRTVPTPPWVWGR